MANDESIQIPFLGGSYEGRSKKINAQQSINLFPVFDNREPKTAIAMYGTPGLIKVLDTSYSKVRMLNFTRNDLFYVTGVELGKFSEDFTKTPLGTLLSSTGKISTADNGIQLLVIDGGGNGYIATTDSLTAITDPSFPSASHCVFSHGYFVVSEVDSGRFYTSKLYDGFTWDALDYATAETASDNLVGLGSTQKNLWLLGTRTVEIYHVSSNPDFPFDRVQGGSLDVGCGAIGSVVEVEGVLYWLTNKNFLARSSGYGFEHISPSSIDYQFNSYSTISDANAYTYTLEGRTFYVISFPTAEATWVLDIGSNQWHQWSSLW